MRPPDKEIEAFEIEITKWRVSKGTKHLAALYTEDRVMLRRILALFRQGKYLEAHHMALGLSEVCRDVIPFACWRRLSDARVADRVAAGPY